LHDFNATAVSGVYGGRVDPPYKRALPSTGHAGCNVISVMGESLCVACGPAGEQLQRILGR
jgi:hypothetical protein